MSTKKILIVAATKEEIAPFIQYIEKAAISNIDILVTGVGMLNTGLELERYLSTTPIDLVINAGIAGAFDKKIEIGTVGLVRSERYGDFIVEEEGKILDFFDLNLLLNEPPFENGKINNPNAPIMKEAPLFDAISVNQSFSSDQKRAKIVVKYAPDIENMEGMAFFKVCSYHKVPFHELRAISNYVEPRNKKNWDIKLAIKNLNDILIKLILQTH